MIGKPLKQSYLKKVMPVVAKFKVAKRQPNNKITKQQDNQATKVKIQ